jgi:hypothetical protein
LGSGFHRGFYVCSDAESGREVPKSGEPDTTSAERINVYLDWFNDLSFEEALCLALDKFPSEVEDLLWEKSYKDITVKLKLYLSHTQMNYSQDYQVLAMIIGGIFGSSPKKDTQKDNKIDYTNPVINTPEQLNAFLGNRGKR